MIVNFTVHGEPQGKARPRFTKTGRTYTPKKTADYEDSIRCAYPGHMMSGAVDVYIEAFFSVPKSYSKAKRSKCLANEIKPTKKPDGDNIIKAVLDALNGTAYHDDSQVVYVAIAKYYSETARITVTIAEEENHAPD